MKSSLLIYFEKYNINILKIKKHADPVIIEKIIKAIDIIIEQDQYKNINDVLGRCYVADIIYSKNTDYSKLLNEDEIRKLKENCNYCPLDINSFYLNVPEKYPACCALDYYDEKADPNITHKERLLWFREYMMKCLETIKRF